MNKHRHSRVVSGVLAFALIVGLLPVAAPHAQKPESARLLTQPEVKTLPAKAKRWALVIGVDKYDDENITPLRGATNDANALANALRDHAGFDENQIILLTNEQKPNKQPTRRNILRYLSNLKGLVPKDGLLLISFSGHGIESNGRAFLIPADATYTDDVRLLEELAVSADVIKRDIKESGVSQVLILLDACRNDPAGGKADSVNPLTEAYRRGFEFDARNREVDAFATLYATSIGARAYEDIEKKEGYFTLAVVEALRGKAADPKTGEVTLQSLVSYVETTVPNRVAVNLGARKIQRPFAEIGGYRANELVLAISPVEPDFGSATAPADNEREAFVAIQNSTSVSEIRAVLEEYPTSRYAADLRKRLERLVWESAKASHDKAQIQMYLNEFGDKAQFASLARIEIRKLTPVQPKASPTPTDGNNNSSTTATLDVITSSNKAASLANQALSEIANGNDEGANKLANEALQLSSNSPLALAVRGWAKEELNIGGGENSRGNLSARIDLERAVKLEPKNAFFRARLISIYQDLNEFSEAQKAAKKVLSLLASPSTALDFYSRGLAHYRIGSTAEAINDFTKAVELNPTFAYAYFARARALNYSEATTADLLKASEIHPRFWSSKNNGYDRRTELYIHQADVLDEAARKLYEAKQYDEAISDFTKAIEVYPGIRYYQNRGLAYFDKKDFEAAIHDFDSVLQTDPNWSGKDLYFYRAQAHKELGHSDQAIADFTKAIERAPQGNNSYLYTYRGNVYYASGDNQSAIREYTKAIELDPHSDSAYNGRGRCYYNMNQSSSAISDFGKAIEIDPKSAVYYRNRGLGYYLGNNYQAAIPDFTKAIELDPQYASAYSDRGDCYRSQKDYQPAIRDYTKAVELDPQNAWHYIRRGHVYFDERHYTAAIREYTKAIDIDPRLANAYDNRGVAYYNDKDYQAAIRDCSKAIELDPKDAFPYKIRSLAYDQTGRHDLAQADRQMYEKLNRP